MKKGTATLAELQESKAGSGARGRLGRRVRPDLESDAQALLKRLEQAGYFAVFSLLGDGNCRPYDWEKIIPVLTGETEALWRFFAAGGRLAPHRAEELLGKPVVDFLKRHKLCRDADGELTLGPISLVTYRGQVFFIERSIMPQGYFSEDTKALMSLLPRMRSGRCLCLYPGSGAMVLPLAARTKVEVDLTQGSFNRGIIEANLELNEAQGKHRFLESVSAGSRVRYDLIVSNPPSAFEPPGVKVPEFIAGGADGRKHVSEVLSLAEKLLTPDGSLLMSFMFFADLDSKLMKERLEAFLGQGLDYSLIVISKHLLQPGVPIFNMIFSSIAAGTNAEGENIARKILDHSKASKFEAAYLIKGRFFHPASAPKREVIDCSDVYYGAWTF